MSTQLRLAMQDLWNGIRTVHVWSMLGWLDIKQRYRRSTLGPFWLTLSTAVLVGGMGPLYGKLFGQPVSTYLLYLSASLVLWLFSAALINEACTAFISAEGYIKQVRLPLTVHVLRVVWRNLIILAHNAAIVAVVALFLGSGLNWYLALVAVGVLLIAVNGVWLGILLGLFCARFRDIPQIVGSVVQVAMFLTPVFWPVDMLGDNRWIAEINPLFHFLEIVRRPLMGQIPELRSWIVVLAVTAAGFILALAFFQRYRARIAYWV